MRFFALAHYLICALCYRWLSIRNGLGKDGRDGGKKESREIKKEAKPMRLFLPLYMEVMQVGKI